MGKVTPTFSDRCRTSHIMPSPFRQFLILSSSHGTRVNRASFLLTLFLPLAAFSQSAGSITPAVPPAPTSQTQASNATSPAGSDPSATTPSRYVEPSSMASYIKKVSSSFSIADRDFDPFGRPQDPSTKVNLPQPSNPNGLKRPTAITATPLSEIVRMIVITTIMPRDRKFLIGTRSFSQGDTLSLVYRGRPLQIRIENVSSSEISFRNAETGETAARKLDLLPPGMTAGNGSITAPGMVLDRPNAPIDLDASELPNDTSHNR